MADYLIEVAGLLVRWLHLIAGIAWIGASFYFVWLDNHLEPAEADDPGVAGMLWSVHGGGFYNNRKFLVQPPQMPKRLHWFKWEAYWTWISGFTLMALVYYTHPQSYLVRPGGDLTGTAAVALSIGLIAVSYVVYDLVCRSPIGANGRVLAVLAMAGAVGTERALSEVYSGRGAYIQVGAMIGTMMVANVLMVIIPGQRRMVDALLAGEAPNPLDGMRGKQRSMHNNYLTLPVLLVMISNHYPLTYGNGRGWLVLGDLMATGMLIRHFVNHRQRGRIVLAPLAGAAALLIGLIVALAPAVSLQSGPAPDAAGAAAPASAPVPTDARAKAIVDARCGRCHAVAAPPAGVDLATLDGMRAHRSEIARVVSSGAMPLGNVTEMTDDERAALVAWAQ